MKKLILILLVITCLFGCTKQNEVIDDCDDKQGCDIPTQGGEVLSAEFKEAYESLNGQTTSSGKQYRELSLGDTSAFKLLDLSKYEDISTKEFNFTGVLFISDPKCPWCRSVIETAVNVVNELNIDNISVIHAWDSEGNEIFRDKYIASAEGSYELQVGHPLYNYLIGCDGSELLSDYIITKDDGSSFETGEKRIYLPSFLYLKDGKIKAFTTGISELQENAYDELTEEMLKDTETQLKDFFAKVE